MNFSTVAIIIQLSFFSSSFVLCQEYNGIEIINGGSVSGIVKVSGQILKDETKKITKNKSHCGETISAEKYVISTSGGVKWAVAILDGIKEGKELDMSVDLVIDNKDCRFVPHVLVAPTGGKLKIRNSDPMLHNSHFYLIDGSRKKNVINLALPRKGQELIKARILRRPGLMSLECDAHDFMQGYIWSLPHPYGAVTDDNGAFQLTEIPAGNYTLKVWHEAFGEKTVSVEVSTGQDTKVKIEYKSNH